MPIRNLVLLTTTTAHVHIFTLSQYLMQCIITQEATLSQHQTVFLKASPSFVHDLRLHLWHKVQHLDMHDFDNVTLPGLKMWRMTQQEEQEILFWFLRKLWWLARLFI